MLLTGTPGWTVPDAYASPLPNTAVRLPGTAGATAIDAALFKLDTTGTAPPFNSSDTLLPASAIATSCFPMPRKSAVVTDPQ